MKTHTPLQKLNMMLKEILSLSNTIASLQAELDTVQVQVSQLAQHSKFLSKTLIWQHRWQRLSTSHIRLALVLLTGHGQPFSTPLKLQENLVREKIAFTVATALPWLQIADSVTTRSTSTQSRDFLVTHKFKKLWSKPATNAQSLQLPTKNFHLSSKHTLLLLSKNQRPLLSMKTHFLTPSKRQNKSQSMRAISLQKNSRRNRIKKRSRTSAKSMFQSTLPTLPLAKTDWLNEAIFIMQNTYNCTSKIQL